MLHAPASLAFGAVQIDERNNVVFDLHLVDLVCLLCVIDNQINGALFVAFEIQALKNQVSSNVEPFCHLESQLVGIHNLDVSISQCNLSIHLTVHSTSEVCERDTLSYHFIDDKSTSCSLELFS